MCEHLQKFRQKCCSERCLVDDHEIEIFHQFHGRFDNGASAADVDPFRHYPRGGGSIGGSTGVSQGGNWRLPSVGAGPPPPSGIPGYLAGGTPGSIYSTYLSDPAGAWEAHLASFSAAEHGGDGRPHSTRGEILTSGRGWNRWGVGNSYQSGTVNTSSGSGHGDTSDSVMETLMSTLYGRRPGLAAGGGAGPAIRGATGGGGHAGRGGSYSAYAHQYGLSAGPGSVPLGSARGVPLGSARSNQTPLPSARGGAFFGATPRG